MPKGQSDLRSALSTLNTGPDLGSVLSFHLWFSPNVSLWDIQAWNMSARFQYFSTWCLILVTDWLTSHTDLVLQGLDGLLIEKKGNF